VNGAQDSRVNYVPIVMLFSYIGLGVNNEVLDLIGEAVFLHLIWPRNPFKKNVYETPSKICKYEAKEVYHHKLIRIIIKK
jgi:hypothetical protein